jgi:hypothetical protein
MNQPAEKPQRRTENLRQDAESEKNEELRRKKDAIVEVLKKMDNKNDKQALNGYVKLVLEDGQISLDEAQSFADNLETEMRKLDAADALIPSALLTKTHLLDIAKRAGFFSLREQLAIDTAAAEKRKAAEAERKAKSPSRPTLSNASPMPGRTQGQEAQIKRQLAWDSYAREKRNQERETENEVREAFSDINPENKEQKLQEIREELYALKDEIEPLEKELAHAREQKTLHEKQSRRRTARPGSQERERDLYEAEAAKMRVILEELNPLRKRYALLNDLHRQHDGRRFGEWRYIHDPDFKKWVDEKSAKDQAKADAMDREDRDKAARGEENKKTLARWNRNRSDTYFEDRARRRQAETLLGEDNLSVSRQSTYIDRTGKDEEHYGRKTKQFSKDPGVNAHINRMGGEKYVNTQNKLRESYIPELTDFVEKNLPTVQDDPNYKRISKAFARAKEQWKDTPDRVYGDLAYMRSQIEYMQKRGKFNQLMNAEREKMTRDGESIPSIHKESVGSAGGRYFSPGEKVRITIPAELLPYSENKDLTVVYEPFTVIGVEDDSQMNALLDAGIIIDKKEALTGTYPDGRPRVRGIDIHFTKKGRYEVNGKPIFAGVEKKETLKGPVLASSPLSFKGNQPGVIRITDVNGKLFTFDVRRTPPNTRIVDATGQFAIARQTGDTFLIEIAEKGTFHIEGFEGQSGNMVYSRTISAGDTMPGQPRNAPNIQHTPSLPSIVLHNPTTPVPLREAATVVDTLSHEEFINSLARQNTPFAPTKDDVLENNLPRTKLAWISDENLEKVVQSSTVQTKKHYLQLIQLKAMIARNLAFQALPVTAENVSKTCEEIIETRNMFKDVPLFKTRNVLYAANNETLKETYPHGDTHRFGKTANVEAIKEQQKNAQGTLTFVRAENSDTDAQRAKKTILDAVVTMRSPMTFYFEGHGLAHNLELTASGNVHITDEELANALRKRHKQLPNLTKANPAERDLIILGCCYNGEFARNVKRNLGKGIAGPIFILESEFGFPGISSFANKFTDEFSETALGLGHRNTDNPSTLGTVIDHEFDENMQTNPSIYLPFGNAGESGWGQLSDLNTQNDPIV